MFNICTPTIYRWRDEAIRVQALPEDQRTKKKAKAKRKSKITPEIRQFIVTHVRNHDGVDKKSIVRDVKRQFNTTISFWSIYAALKAEKQTYKRRHFRTRETDPTKLAAFFEQLALKKKEQIVSVDEASFDTHMTQKYGWSTRGEKCFARPKGQSGRKRVSLEMAVTSDGIVSSQTVQGSYNTTKFCSFLSDVLLPAIRRKNRRGQSPRTQQTRTQHRRQEQPQSHRGANQQSNNRNQVNEGDEQ